MDTCHAIRRAHSCATDPREAVRELHAGLEQPQTALVMFFCSSAYDLPMLAEEIKHQFAGCVVVGCTTAGEIGPNGYCAHSLSGFSLPRGDCQAEVGRLDGLQTFSLEKGDAFARNLQQQLEVKAPEAEMPGRFGLMLIDGLSVREESVARTFQYALGKTKLIGGSAGDDMIFSHTKVFHDGAFHEDSAILVLVATRYPFRLFITQHFKSEEERVVVTSADAAKRIVKEINGLPAADEYARLIGVKVENLTAEDFSARPVVVVIDGADYVRSIQKANPDGSLVFFSAIDEGLVLRIAHGMDLVQSLKNAIDAVRAEIGPVQLLLGCDCALRNLEMMRNGSHAAVNAIFYANNGVGFSTYGEQYKGVHVNQTLVGVAMGYLQEPLQ